MAVKSTRPKSLFLYLTLACFFGLIAIFITDGYMGVYDTITVTAREAPQRIESDFWLRGDFPFQTGVSAGERVPFNYEIDNRQFSAYSSDVSVSVWRAQQKLLDVTSEQLTIPAWGKDSVEWSVDAEAIRPAGIPIEQSFEFTVVIERGDIERRVIIFVNPIVRSGIPVPAPPKIN